MNLSQRPLFSQNVVLGKKISMVSEKRWRREFISCGGSFDHLEYTINHQKETDF